MLPIFPSKSFSLSHFFSPSTPFSLIESPIYGCHQLTEVAGNT